MKLLQDIMTEATEDEDQKFMVTIVAKGEVEVYADTPQEAIKHAKEMFESGDAAASLDDAKFKAVKSN